MKIIKSNCFLAAMFILLIKSLWLQAQVTDPAFKKPNEHSLHQQVRIFEGRLEKHKKWYSFIVKQAQDYQLMKKDKTVALLDFSNNKRMLDLVSNLVGKNVFVKGNPQYMNKEPFLLIIVKEICEQ